MPRTTGSYVDFQPDSEHIITIGGEPRRDVVVTLGPDLIDKMAKGYMCLACYEDFSHTNIGAYPEKCPNFWCGYEVKERQPREFAESFGGVDVEWVAMQQRAEDAGLVIP
jgi:hypothetical protein